MHQQQQRLVPFCVLLFALIDGALCLHRQFPSLKATAVGANHQGAQNILKQDYQEECTLEEAKKLIIKVLMKTMDSTTLTPEKMELSTVTRDEATGQVICCATAARSVLAHLFGPLELGSCMWRL